MPREIKMPKLSDTMEEGTVNVWRKREGDSIQRGEVLLEVETDKADMEYEAYVSGTLVKILVREGETVSVGTLIAVVRLESDSDEDVAALLAGLAAGAPAAVPAAAASAKPPAPPEAPASTPAPAAMPAPAAPATPAPAPSALALPPAESRLAFFLPDPDRVRATPRARVVAGERGVDLSEIGGSGPDGAVIVSDVERYAKALEEMAQPAEADVPVTPVAARIADEMGIDLSRVTGTGPGGRVTKRDLRAHLEREQAGSSGRAEALYGDEIKLSQKRKFLIRQMTESKQSTPHFYVSMDVDAAPMQALRERLKADGQRITYTHMLVKAAAVTLGRQPDVNASWRDDRIVLFQPVNVGVAVAVGDELVAPVVKDCQGRSLADLAESTDSLIQRAREKKLSPDDYSDGTFTISNLGMFGVDFFYAIITPPQATVLSVGGMREVPVVDGGELTLGRRIMLGLGVDHRVLDGAKAAQFLAELKRVLEQPQELLADEGDAD
jgi:pyruvate dehydrogenase E2 component (dihydrolipoamide acetyltransferase)